LQNSQASQSASANASLGDLKLFLNSVKIRKYVKVDRSEKKGADGRQPLNTAV